MLCWPLYDEAVHSRWLCAAVPGLATLQFLLVGLGVLKDKLVTASSTVGCTNIVT